VPLARALIGTTLVRRLPSGELLTGRIVETEAYTPSDPSSHAYRGLTARNASMFKRHLHAYVYFIYGTAFCLNITSEEVDVGAAVLIRAVEPLTGIDIMRAHRGFTTADRDLARGPGRLCRAFAIDRALDGADLETSVEFWLAAAPEPVAEIGESTRIGLTKATELPHRFYARGSRFLSGPRALNHNVGMIARRVRRMP
jgi:DNA-3-methyladenine glycosylase